MTRNLQAVRLDSATGEVVILDQTLLPGEVKFLRLRTAGEIWEAIRVLRVRGAPAIGIAAGFGAYAAGQNIQTTTPAKFLSRFLEATRYIVSSRPTAVNLSWAIKRMENCAAAAVAAGSTVADIRSRLLAEATAIQDADERQCKAIGRHGLTLLQRGWGLLTHCNAGQLAASRYGTALAPIYTGHEQGYGFKVFADETRPLLQGARLTAFELASAGVDVTLICDNMAQTVMRRGLVQAILVGCDRVAANGDAANKIGTAGLAVMAAHFGIPFYVLGPTSTLDPACPTGADIVIEERPAAEVTDMWYARPMAPAGVKIFNPAFDVTPAELITAIITEKGIARPPFAPALREMLAADS